MTTSTSAPGKLFLLGEYAVLAGGPALLTATSRRIHVLPQTPSGPYQVLGADFDDPFHLPRIVLDVLAEHNIFPALAKHRDHSGSQVQSPSLIADLRELYSPGGEKLGLGSSAASTVALITAMAPELDIATRFELAFQAHRQLQNGRGSGADIATSTFGGTLAFTLKETLPPFDQLLDLPLPVQGLSTPSAIIETGLHFPQQLQIYALWTGAPAHTVSFLSTLRKATDRKHPQIRTLFSSIAEVAADGIHALRESKLSPFLWALAEGDRLMEELGDLLDLPIVTDTHRQIRAIADAAGFTAKPSGAGGGDFTLVAGPRERPFPPELLESFLSLPLHSPVT